MLEHRSPESLRQFVAAVEPQIAYINEFLDSFAGKRLSDAAAALGTLAECVAEAKIIISKA
jgi:hypothetical protein